MEFEEQARQLAKETFAGSTQLRDWCKRKRNRWYIPEWLLGAWGIEVDPSFSGEERMRRE